MWRPVMAEPPLCTIRDVRTVLTLDDVFDLNEMLDLREHATAKAMQNAERGRR
ncbi:hypothetical protein ABEG18_13015 [Alsobacter sp. KACC 23698]|uniref:Uncharacterized protein n=1 Tax=Alsobacter sp. KACC 23698 TaxID=3149229 RepID=A0AAU7JNW1_9HYPH